MLEAFERHLQHRKNLVDLEKIQNHQDLIEFCKKTLAKEGIHVKQTRLDNTFFYRQIIPLNLLTTDEHLNYIIYNEKKIIEERILASVVKKYPIEYNIENIIHKNEIIIIAKMEL